MCLTKGRLNSCGTVGTGGVARIALASREDIESITVDSTTRAVTAIVMKAGKKFYKFDYTSERVKFKETSTRANKSSLFEQMLDATAIGYSQDDRNSLEDLHACSACGMVAIHEEETGVSWIWGINPSKPDITNKYYVELEKTDRDTKEKFDEENSHSLTLKARTTKPATQFTPGWAGVPLT
jgi:hypothetical protein